MLCSCVLGKYSFLLESVPSSNFIKFLGIQCGAAFTWHFSLQIQLSNIFYVPPYVFSDFSDLYLLQSLPSVQSVFRSSIRNHQERATGAKHMGHLDGALNEAPFRYTRVEVASSLLPPRGDGCGGCFSPPSFGFECIFRKVKNNKPEDCLLFPPFLSSLKVEQLASDETSSNYTLLNIRSIPGRSEFSAAHFKVLRNEYGTSVGHRASLLSQRHSHSEQLIWVPFRGHLKKPPE